MLTGLCTLVIAVVLQEPPVAEGARRSEPTVLAAVAPEFPNIAIQARISGRVPVDVEVGADGVPVAARAQSGPELLVKAAEAAALRWRFSPSPEASEHAHVTVVFAFRAMENDTPVVCHQQVEERVTTFKPPLEIELLAKPYVCYLPPTVTTKRKKP